MLISSSVSQDYLGQFEANLGEIVSSGSTTKPLKPYNGSANCGSIISMCY